jgi:hypothetical protein
LGVKYLTKEYTRLSTFDIIKEKNTRNIKHKEDERNDKSGD